MKHSTNTRRRWLARVALGLAVVAVAAPSAQGMIPGDTSPGTSSGQVTDGLGRPLDPALAGGHERTPTVVVDTSKFRIDAQIANEPVRPDDRAVRPAIVGFAQTPLVATPVDRSSFDWNDAGVGIGIGVAAALAALAGWIMLAGRRRDHLTDA